MLDTENLGFLRGKNPTDPEQANGKQSGMALIKDRIATAIAMPLKSVRSGRFGRLRFRLIRVAYRVLPYLGYDYSRGVEWEFVLNNLPRARCRLVEIGSALSLFAYELSGRGHDVLATDYSPHAERLQRAQIKFLRSDIMALPLESATIDAIVMISVIEHIGMGAYGDPVVEDGDMKAMEEIRRVLRPGGLLILTTNIRATAGARIIHPPDGLERIYDIDRLRHLRRGFEVLEEVLYILRRDNRWVPGDYADLCSSTHWAIACLALKRK